MKTIKYNFLSCEINHGTEKSPNIEQILLEKTMFCKNQTEFDDNYPIAEKEAVGEIIVEGEFDMEEITRIDAVEAQVVYTAMMTDTLLEV